MKRFLIFLAGAVLMSSLAAAEALPGTTGNQVVFQPQAQQAPALAASEGELQLDFSLLTPDNPAATPVAVDPIDKPTPTPTPAPSFVYEKYDNPALGISFSIPYTWLLNPNTNHETTIQFVEPKSEMMDVGGYQTRITIEKYNMGLTQTAAEARDRLESIIEELAASFTAFSAGSIDSGDFGDARGYYCYYKAEYNDGSKNYEMNGRVIVVAHDKCLYQIRLTTPREWYSYYNHLWRKIRSTIKYQ